MVKMQGGVFGAVANSSAADRDSCHDRAESPDPAARQGAVARSHQHDEALRGDRRRSTTSASTSPPAPSTRCSARTAPASRPSSSASWASIRPTRAPCCSTASEIEIRNPRDARANGIGMVYQHFTLVPSLTAAENLVISRADAAGRHQLAEGEAAAGGIPRQDAVPRAARRAGLRARGRREAEARDPEAALSRPALPDPRRADLGADPRRGRRDPGPLAADGAGRGHHRR